MVLPVIAVPWIIGGLSAVAGVFGLKKGVTAKKNFSRAKNLVEYALDDFKEAKSRLDGAREKSSKSLSLLGRLRIETEAQDMKRFVNIVQRINKAAYTPIQLGDTNVAVSLPTLGEIEISSYQARDMLQDGVGAISSGVLVGVGASGLATSSLVGAVASTGTLIGSLSGAAATNATLAWLGGGALSAGGMGMVGGTAVLGGVVAGPAIAIMGFVAASKSEKALTEAYAKESEVREATGQIENGISLLYGVQLRTEEIHNIVLDLRLKFSKILSDCDELLASKIVEKDEAEYCWNNVGIFKKIFRFLVRKKFSSPMYFSNFSQKEKDLYFILNIFGMSLYKMIKVQIINNDGLVADESAQVVSSARSILMGVEHA